MIVEKYTITSEYKSLYSLQPYKIGIPIFQRFYAWRGKEIIQLLNDILLIIKEPSNHLYLLDFIYYEEDGKLKLADGQQRLVTINNLIKAIKEVAQENEIEIESIEYFDISYDVFSNDRKYQTHFYNYVTVPFKTVYLEMVKYVNKNIEEINNIISVIKNNIYIFLKKCTNADDAFVIFQQINTGGKPLSKDEVIKTAIDQYSIAYDIKVDTTKIKDVRQSLISYYKLKKNDPNKNFDNMEIITFLKEYITKDKKSFKEFSETINLLVKSQNNPLRYVINYINRATLIDLLNILVMKNIDTMTNKEYRSKLMLPLCLASIVLTINGGSPTSYRYLLIDIISKVKNNEKVDDIQYYLINYFNRDPLTWKISLDDFSKALGSIEVSRNLKKGLLLMDVIDKNVSGVVNVNSINLEHVYPQNPNYEWAMNGWPSHREDQLPLIDNIGNYLLLNERVNKSVQNRYISYKVFQYKTIIAKDKILQTPINSVDFVMFEKDREKYIYSRQHEIAKTIQKTFPLGKVLIK